MWGDTWMTTAPEDIVKVTKRWGEGLKILTFCRSHLSMALFAIWTLLKMKLLISLLTLSSVNLFVKQCLCKLKLKFLDEFKENHFSRACNICKLCWMSQYKTQISSLKLSLALLALSEPPPLLITPSPRPSSSNALPKASLSAGIHHSCRKRSFLQEDRKAQ